MKYGGIIDLEYKTVTDPKLRVKRRVKAQHERQWIKLKCSGMERKTAKQTFRRVKQVLKTGK